MAQTDLLLSTDFNNQQIMLNTQQTLFPISGTFTYSFAHNLGYIPSVRVWYEAEVGGWYPITIRQYSDSTLNTYLKLIGSYSLTTSSFNVEIRDTDGLATQCNILARLYLND